MRDHDPSPAVAVLALAAVVLTSASGLLAAVALRLAPASWAFAWPWPDAAPPAGPTLAVVAACAVLMARLAWAAQRDPVWRRSLITALAWPAVPLAAGWLLAPASGARSPAALAAAAVIAAAAAWLLRQERAHLSGRAKPRPGRPRVGWLALHAVAAAALAALGLWGGGFTDSRAFLLSSLAYPLFALIQLLLVLAVTWPHLHRLAGGRDRGAVAAVALLFALVHWPNPVLMLLTGAGMVFWAAAYARGRGLVVLAVSMGLLATLAAQGLPDRWTDHMRVGPRFVWERTAVALAAQTARRTANVPAGEQRTQAFLRTIYPELVGREAAPEELARWWRSIAACRRGVLAWRFYLSEEYQRKFGGPAGEAPLPGDVHWTRLPAPWPARIDAFTRDLPGTVPPTWESFLSRLYREILRREPLAAELAAWPRQLSLRQRERLVTVLLERRRELATAPFDTCSCGAMRLHH